MAKTQKAATSAKVRKATVRKSLTKELRALEAIRKAFDRTRRDIEKQTTSLNGDAYNQIADVYQKLGIAVEVTQAHVDTKATELARTFIGK